MIRDRRSFGRSRDSIGAFRSQLDVLNDSRPVAGGGRQQRSVSLSAPAGSSMPRNAHEAEGRRRDILRVLIAAAIVTFVAALFLGGLAVWAFHLLVDGCLAAYAFLVVRLRSETIRQDENVHYLPPRVVVEEDRRLVRQAR